jgi:preprotein translocase subunit Sec61beta
MGIERNHDMNTPFPGIVSFFSAIDASVTISPYIVLAIAGFFALIGTVLGIVFSYHWKAYGIDKVEVLQVRFWYYLGSVVFGGGMVLSALAYALGA